MQPSIPKQMEAYRRGDVHAPPLLPEKMLMICDWGDTITSWLDCAQPEFSMFSSKGPLDWQKFKEEVSSLLEWMEVWRSDIQLK